ncbi:MAG: hypothetical protein IT211_14805 [Armatimonadetes bacterium]|nr:hypothetical protein [Armatimonadota bacterium]
MKLMSTQVAWWKKLAAFAAVAIAAQAMMQPAQAQDKDEKERIRLDRAIANLIPSLDDIVWANVRIWQVRDELLTRIKKGLESEDAADRKRLDDIGQLIAPEPLPDFATNALTTAQRPAVRTVDQFRNEIAKRYSIDKEDVDETEAGNAFGIAKGILSARDSRPDEYYIVTSRVEEGIQPRIISLIGMKRNIAESSLNIKFVKGGSEVYSWLTANRSDTTIYGEMKQAVAEPGSVLVKNMTNEMRDLSKLNFTAVTKARASYLNEGKYPYILTSITEGRPLRAEPKEATPDDSSGGEEDAGGLFGDAGGDAGGLFGEATTSSENKVDGAKVAIAGEYPYEVGVGNDVVVSFRKFKLNEAKKVIPETDWGVELRNNLDELNYPSIWGGRMTLNAMLENVKLGVVLPTLRFGETGDTNYATSGFGNNNQKILGGIGAAFSGDFAFPIMDNSGLFNVFATYTFSEQDLDDIRPRKLIRQGGSFVEDPNNRGERAWLVRYAAQTYYSFGFFLDDNAQFLFRLKLGATMYGMDEFARQNDTTALIGEKETMVFAKTDDETKASVSGKLEFMRSGTRIPFGAGIQYLDQSILGNIWLQFFPSQRWDLKVEGKLAAAILRDPYPWENKTIFVPSVTVKYHF